jgi:hypothetical protein
MGLLEGLGMASLSGAHGVPWLPMESKAETIERLNMQTEIIGPDYQRAFGHLAYIVGQIATTEDESAKAELMRQATALIDAVYKPIPMIIVEPEGADAVAEIRRKLIRDGVFGPIDASTITQSTPLTDR